MISTDSKPNPEQREVCTHCRIGAPRILMDEIAPGSYACRNRVACAKRQRRLPALVEQQAQAADYVRPQGATPVEQPAPEPSPTKRRRKS